MPQLNVNFPKLDPDISCTLNELDYAVGDALFKVMRQIDPRIRKSSKLPMWTRDRVLLSDELDIQTIFQDWLDSNKSKSVNVTYPLLGYTVNPITEVNQGAGIRPDQWNFLVQNAAGQAMGQIKAKGIVTEYTGVVLVGDKQEARYIQNQMMVEMSDRYIYWTYNSDVLNNNGLGFYSVMNIPELNVIPTEDDKLRGKGYIYGVGFTWMVWGIVSNKPLPYEVIEQINMKVHVETEIRESHFVFVGDYVLGDRVALKTDPDVAGEVIELVAGCRYKVKFPFGDRICAQKELQAFK